MRSRWSRSRPAVWFWPVLTLCACPAPNDPQITTETTLEASTTGPDVETGLTTTTGPCAVGAPGCPCTGGGVCDPGLVCSAEHVCVEAGVDVTETTGPDPSGAETDTTSTLDEATTTTSETTPSELCDPSLGQPNPGCDDADEPYCAADGSCGGCSVLPAEAGCAVVTEGMAPVCDPRTDRCVECTADDASLCVGDKPACNLDTNVCEGCLEHSQCPESACNILQRECFDEDRVLHVRLGVGGLGCVEQVPIGGSSEKPYCQASMAIQHAQQSGSDGWVIKFMQSDFLGFYHPGVLIPGNNEQQTYAFVHEPGDPSERHTRFVTATLGLSLGAEVTLYLDGFTIEIDSPPSDQSVGVLCQSAATLYMTDSFIVGARGPGIRGLGCDVHMRRSSVYDGWSEGLDLTDGKLEMVNSFITENHYVKDRGGGGITATNTALRILYSTIVANNNEPMKGGDSIHCKGGVVGEVRNSVIGRKSMGNNPSVNCPTDGNNLKILTSVVDGGEDLDGDGDPGNNTGGNSKLAGEDIVLSFAPNLTNGVYTVAKTAEAKKNLGQTAVWKSGDPRQDYEGDARNLDPAGYDFAGGDVAK